MASSSLHLTSIYAVERMALVVFLYLVWCLQIGHRFPDVVAFGVASPFDQILQLFLSPMMLVAPNGLELVLFFASYQVWGWP